MREPEKSKKDFCDLVSVIIPVYNAEKYIGDTIHSILSQTVSDWEMILVDDCSTDRSVEIIESYTNEKIRLIRMGNGGSAAKARNAGVKAARGRYIAFLDADDLWHPDKLEKQLDFMRGQCCGFSFTGYEFAGPDGIGVEKIVRVPKIMDYKAALKNTTIFTSTVMFDREKIDNELLQMPQVPSEDTATWWQILRAGYLAYGYNEALTLYRRGGGTLSSNKLTAIRRVWNLYRNVEHLSLPHSAYCFLFYAAHAVLRRL